MGHPMEHHHSYEEGRASLRHFLPFLALPLAIGVLRGMARRHHFMHGYAREGMQGRGAWENGVPPFFAEWHRRAHEAPPKPEEPEVKES